MKIKTIDITPLKMGRLKSSGEIRAIACRLSLTWDDGHMTHRHVDTKEGGIFHAYSIAQKMILDNMKERGIA